MKSAKIVLSVLPIVLLAGCGDEKKPSAVVASVAEEKAAVARSAASGVTQTNLEDVVFAVVNGEKLTAAEVRGSVLVLERVQTLAKHPPNAKYLATWRNVTAMKIVPQLISSMLIEQEARHRKIAASDESKKRVLSKYARLAGEKELDIDRVAAHFGDEADAFRRQFGRETLFDTFFEMEGARAWTENDVDAFLVDATNRVRFAKSLNEMARKRANSAWEELKAGTSWKEVVAEYDDEDPDDGDARGYADEWETFRLKDCYLREVGEALVGKKEGEYTKPVECEAGMVIARVVKIEDDIYTCARILIRMSVDMQVPRREGARMLVARQKRTDVQKKLLKELRTKADLQFPLGTNFTYRIWQGGQVGKLNGIDVRRVNGSK